MAGYWPSSFFFFFFFFFFLRFYGLIARSAVGYYFMKRAN